MRNLGVSIIAAWSVLATTGTARADETEELRGLLDQPVLSAASRKAEVASAAPATSSTITAEQLRRYGIRTLDEALNFLSMGMTASDRLHGVEVGARGVLVNGDYGNHVLLLVNGHAVNEQWTGGAVFERGAGIPMELVDHIEVILGPGSVLYGSGAMLGVINVVTKRAKDYRGVHLIAESELPISVRAAVGAGTDFEYQGDRGEVTVQVEYYAQRGPTFTFGPQAVGLDSVTGQPKRYAPDGPGGVWGGDASRSYWSVVPAGHLRAILGPWELNLRASSYKRSIPVIDTLSNPAGDFNVEENYEVDAYGSADLIHRARLGGGLQLMTRLYGDVYRYEWYATSTASEDCYLAQIGGCRGNLHGETDWGGFELQPTFDWWQDGVSVTTVGVDARVRHNEQVTTEDGLTDGSRLEQKDMDRIDGTVGLYAQQAVRPASWLSMSAGVRGDLDPRFDGMHFSPRGAVAVMPWDGTTVRVIYAEAFRAPSVYEAYYSEPSYWAMSRDLLPETVRSVEVSLEQRAGTHRLFAGVFRSWWENMIFLDSISAADVAAEIARGELDPGVTDAVQYRNAAEIDNHGVNAGIDGGFLQGKLRYGASLTGAVSRRHNSDGSTQPLTVTPAVSGNARLSYDFEGDLPVLAVVGQLLGPRPADRAYDGGFSTKPFVDTSAVLRGTVSGDVPWIPGMSYRVTAEYATGSAAPYVVGPHQNAADAADVAELSPIDRFRTGIGLQYEFGKGSEP
jgi:outer membrane receptor for ferrienterochelin and colicins